MSLFSSQRKIDESETNEMLHSARSQMNKGFSGAGGDRWDGGFQSWRWHLLTVILLFLSHPILSVSEKINIYTFGELYILIIMLL